MELVSSTIVSILLGYNMSQNCENLIIFKWNWNSNYKLYAKHITLIVSRLQSKK